MESYQIEERQIMYPLKQIKICNITFETFPVVHSILAPGVGYRITAGKSIIFCVHDLISINERQAALHNVQLYIGDGATIARPLVRRKDNKIFGHTTVRAQLGWCQKEHVPKMIITHCGSQIVGEERKSLARVRAMAKEHEVEVAIAYDGMQVEM